MLGDETIQDPPNRHRAKVVSISPFLGYYGVPHAGGEYVRRHLQALSAFTDVTSFAPRPRDVPFGDLPDVPAYQTVLHNARPSRARRLLDVALKAWRGASLSSGQTQEFKRSSALLEALNSADIVEFHWTESASLLTWVKNRRPEARVVLIVHDVLAHRWRTAALSVGRSGRDRVFYRLRATVAAKAERKAFRSVDVVVAFSDEDRARVLSMAPDCVAVTVRPSLEEPSMNTADVSHRVPRTLLFTGAMARPENDGAARRLVSSIYPALKIRFPDLKLVIAGAQPSESLLKEADNHQDVTVTGFVESMDSLYQEASLFVVPLDTGAGVKFKVVTSMLWGLPVVASPVAADGIGEVANYVGICESDEDFIGVLTSALLNPDRARLVGQRSQSWAQRHFGDEQFTRALESIYLSTVRATND